MLTRLPTRAEPCGCCRLTGVIASSSAAPILALMRYRAGAAGGGRDAGFAAALMGGLLFGFSPFLISEVGQGHPNLDLAWLIPLCGYLVVRLVEGSIRAGWFAPLLGLLLAVQLYLGSELFVTMTLIGGLFGLIGLALSGPARRTRLWRAVGPIAGAYGVALALGSPLLYVAFTRPRPYKPVVFTGIGHGADSVGDFLGYVVPGRFTILGGQWGQRWGPTGTRGTSAPRCWCC
jgi:hypothetical protein